jgi:hypothetical protein
MRPSPRTLAASVVVALATVLSLLAVPSALSAPTGPPGTWTRITDKTDRNTDEVGLARTGDGVLHVLWRRATGSTSAIWHTPVTPAGAAGAASVVLDGFSAADNPDVVVQPDGRLRTFFNGLGDSLEEGGVVSASAPASGVGWTREGARVSSRFGALDWVGAGLTAAGAPVSAYTMSFVLAIHVGLDPAAADVELQPDNRCCDYSPDVATDARTGQTFLAWFSNAEGRSGIWAQQIAPQPGPQLRAPGSAVGGDAIGTDQRTPITARLGAPGVYVAYCGGYPTCKRVLLWRVGAAKPFQVGASPDVEDVHVSPGPQGRLWVAWHEGQHARRIFAVRTNTSATCVGPATRVAPPAGTSAIWKTKGDGSLGPLDLFASVSTAGSLATWHTRVLPRLTLRATKRKGAVTLIVTDACEPVAGAALRIGGKSRVTNARGRVTLTLGKGRHKATASKAGYAPATISVRLE